MTVKLKLKDYLLAGSMLFGLFFGAGNLIFPVNLGQNAGSAVAWANLGFLVTAVGLPFLSVIAIGFSGASGVQELASRVGMGYGIFFTLALYLTIGPFFALPRLASTAFTIGISPFVSPGRQRLVLAVFSILFYGAACIASIKPNKLLNIVGKYLNPLFLVLLAVLLAFVFIFPLGSIHGAAISGAYRSHPFSRGMTDGYNTLDLLAGLAFAIVVISTLKNLGLQRPADIAAATLKSGIVVVILMALIYTALSFAGTLSLGRFAPSSNGGIALSQIAQHYLDKGGFALLALIVTVACLKTAIGLITSCASAAFEMSSHIKYLPAVIVTSAASALFANAGLDTIIQASLPVLMFLYPLAITLSILALLERFCGKDKRIYRWVTILTAFAALFDALNQAPAFLKDIPAVQTMLSLWAHIPLFDHGLGWVLPALLGFVCGLIHQKLSLRYN